LDALALLEIAKRAARVAAEVHRRAMERVRFDVGTKSSNLDLVTEVDREAERTIVDVIRSARPNDSILGEEGSALSGSSGVRWVIDPLDGTTNFIHGYPAHSVAVGIEFEGRRVAGVVIDTYANRTYSGVVGQGATCDKWPITVKDETDLHKALVGTGFLPDAEVRRLQAEILKNVLPRVRDIRRSGCPSLDICGVASGALDAFYEFGLGPWDIAAAGAIAEAAGAEVIELTPAGLPGPLLVVTNPDLAPVLISLVMGSDD
jgi:myo-inositol-1(or 4)-monophosphatase